MKKTLAVLGVVGAIAVIGVVAYNTGMFGPQESVSRSVDIATQTVTPTATKVSEGADKGGADPCVATGSPSDSDKPCE